MKNNTIKKALIGFSFLFSSSIALISTESFEVAHAASVDVTVTSFVTNAWSGNNFVYFILSQSDYSSAPAYTNANSSFDSANFYSHVLVNDTYVTQASQCFFNFDSKGGFALHLGPGGNDYFLTMNTITLLEGLTFPSYSGSDTYVLSKDMTFTLGSGNINENNVVWEQELEEVETGISNLYSYPNGGNHFISIVLDDSDYASSSGTNSATTAFAAFKNNFMSHCYVNGVAITSCSQPFFNFFESHGFGINIGNSVFETAVRIDFKKGLKLPTYSNEESCYVLDKDYGFVLTSGSAMDGDKTWTSLSNVVLEEETSISSIKMVTGYDTSTKWIRIALSNNDYGDSSSVGCDYNLRNSNIVNTSRVAEYNLYNHILINGSVYDLSSVQMYLNYYSVFGTIAFILSSDLVETINTITILGGTCFPSVAYINKDSTLNLKTSYVVSDTLTFEKHGSTFYLEGTYTIQEENTSVDGITVKTQDSGFAFAFHLSNSDYDGEQYITSIVDVDELNFLESIKLNTYNSNPFTTERFINVWNNNGCFVLRSGPVGVDFATELTSIEILAGCQFPSYSYGSGASNEYKIYVTTKKMMFVNDGTGNFILDKAAYDYTIPSGYTPIWTTVNSVTEQNGTDLMSFFEVGLSVSDYSSYSMTGLSSYSAKLKELKFYDYVYINNVKLSTLMNGNPYTLDSFVNFTLSSSFAFRKVGNNTGCYYKSGANVIETEDKTAYDVAFAKGCAFPSMSYLKGQTSTPTCYVVSENVRFVYTHGQYVKTTDLNEPNRIQDDVVSISSHGSGVDTGIDIELQTFDYPTTVYDKDIYSSFKNYSFSKRIAIMKTDGTFINSFNEFFVNVWGKKGCFTFRKPSSLSWSDISYVIIYAGAEFPTYDAYLGLDNSSYCTSQTARFASNGDGTFTKCNDLSASDYASLFLEETNAICANYDGITNNKTALEAKFDELSETYRLMTYDQRSLINEESSSENVLAMLARYDYLVAKYGLDNFMNRQVKTNLVERKSSSNNNLVILISLLSVSIVGMTSLYIIRRRRAK